MIIPISIPIGEKHVAVIRGTTCKVVDCEACGNRYAYGLELVTQGEDYSLPLVDKAESVERAQIKAIQNLKEMERNALAAVPCPHCGHYQADMVKKLKGNGAMNVEQIVGLIITAAALVTLAFDFSYQWVVTGVLFGAGIGLVGLGAIKSVRRDPNSGDPEARKAIGRAGALWGEQLRQLMVESAEKSQTVARASGETGE